MPWLVDVCQGMGRVLEYNAWPLLGRRVGDVGDWGSMGPTAALALA
jgi:hypothetical protein